MVDAGLLRAVSTNYDYTHIPAATGQVEDYTLTAIGTCV